jgi:hypothetical protein
MKAQLMYFLAKGAYKLLRPHIVEVVEDKLKLQWTVIVLNMLDELFGYNFKCGDGHYDDYDIQS